MKAKPAMSSYGSSLYTYNQDHKVIYLPFYHSQCVTQDPLLEPSTPPGDGPPILSPSLEPMACMDEMIVIMKTLKVVLPLDY